MSVCTPSWSSTTPAATTAFWSATNSEDQQIVAPGGARTYRWYAGDLTYNTVGQQGNTELLELVATPVEFGGSNLLSADRVKQPQKGLFGALSILPAGSTVAEDTQVPDGQGSGS